MKQENLKKCLLGQRPRKKEEQVCNEDMGKADTTFSTIRSCDLCEARETGTIPKKVD